MCSVWVTSRDTDTVRGTTRRPHFSIVIISVTVQLRIQVFWVISVYFNLRNILPKSGTFPPQDTLYTLEAVVAAEESFNILELSTLSVFNTESVKKMLFSGFHREVHDIYTLLGN